MSKFDLEGRSTQIDCLVLTADMSGLMVMLDTNTITTLGTMRVIISMCRLFAVSVMEKEEKSPSRLDVYAGTNTRLRTLR